jgi:hypothetical protein
MLASITPLGERGRGRRWGVTVTGYVLASTAGGLTMGTILGWMGGVLGGAAIPARAATVTVVLGAALVDGFGLRLPTTRRQVNEDWLVRYRGWVYGTGFGFQLGMGVVTIVTTATVYATLALAVMAATPAAGAMIGASFGLVRALPVLAVAGVDQSLSTRHVHLRMHLAARWSRRASVVLLCAAAGAVLA